jgi:FG-GAP-like repeat
MTTFNVNQTTDNGKGDTAGTLSYAILQANDQAGDDQIVLDNDVRMTGAMQQLIASNINIVGNNHKLSGDVNNNATVDTGDVRPLFVFSGTVGINDLTITNGLAQGDKAGEGFGAHGGGAGMGGGLFIYDGAVSLNNVTLNNNKAIGGGPETGGSGSEYRRGSGGGSGGVVGINGTGVVGTSVVGIDAFDVNGIGGNAIGGSGDFGGNGGSGKGGNSVNGIGGSGSGGSGGFGGNGGSGKGGKSGKEPIFYTYDIINNYYTSSNQGTGGSGGFGGGGGDGGGGGGLSDDGSRYKDGVGIGGNGGFGGGGGAAYGFWTFNSGSAQAGRGGFGGSSGIGNGFLSVERPGNGAGFGGAIFIRSGSLSLSNTTLTNNSATGGTSNDAANSGLGYGGAIFVMNITTNTNGNNQGMPTTLPIVVSQNTTIYENNVATDDATTNNFYGPVRELPTITRARYDINSGSLLVTGTDFLALAGTNNDINPSKLTITGEGGTSYTLTSANVDLTNSTSFTVALNAADKTALKSIITKKGTQSNSNNTYNLAAAEDWNAGAAPFFDADLTNNGLTAVADPIFNPNPFGITNVGANSTPTFGDIDGNGTLDAFIGNQAGNTLFFKNTGTTTAPAFAPAVANPFGLTSGVVFYAPTLVDIDGNGTLDIFVGGLLGNTQFFKNTGTNTAPAFAPAVSNPFGLSSVGGESAPTFADIDGDGKLDAMMGNTAGDTIFFKNTGTTTAPAFAPAVTNPFGLTSVGNDSKPTFTDVDGDGTLDAVIGNRTGDTLFFRNIGTKTVPAFAPAVTNPFGVTNVGSDSAPAIVDINGDGTLETFVGNSAGNTLFFSNLQPPATTPTRNDFNGDGKSDILWRSTDGSVITWQMNGATVTSENSLLTATPGSLTTANPDWKIAGTGDFNGDRKSDLLRQNSTTGNVETWQINGSTVVAKTAIGNATGWQAAGTGDFNGDGKSDILWRNDGVVALWQMDGATVTASTVGTPSNDWKVASTGDFDGDGKADILWQKDAGDLALWQMDGAAVVKATSFAVVPTGWKIAGSGDFNGDSKSDLVLRNQNGDVAEWQMNGTQITSTAVVGNAPTDWQIAEAGNDLNGDGKADLLWLSATGGVASWQMDGFKVLTAGATSIPTAATTWSIVAPVL